MGRVRVNRTSETRRCLVGGSNSFALQPESVEGRSGFNLVATATELELRAWLCLCTIMGTVAITTDIHDPIFRWQADHSQSMTAGSKL
jgi:hypothetical protein